MEFETFRGRDVKEALTLVRAAFGVDAIIASTRVVKNGRDGGLSQSFVEVKAAPSEAPSAPSPQHAFPYAQRNSSTPPQSHSSSTSRGALPRSIPPAPRMPTITMPPPSEMSNASVAASAAVENEVRALRELVEQMLAQKTPKDRVLMTLAAFGVEGRLANELAKGLTKSDDESSLDEMLQARLRDRVSCAGITFQSGKKQLIACVGSTGTGKTTTLAKLAAHAFLERGVPAGIITLDTYRVGAVEQMRRFASLIGIPFSVAHDEASFRAAIDISPDLVFVDTPSRGPKDEAASARLSSCLAAATEHARDILLTIPAHARAADAEDLVRSYRKLAPSACVLTKLDETPRRGGAVAGAIATKLPVAFLCAGPRVPEDLESATPASVAKAVLGGTSS